MHIKSKKEEAIFRLSRPSLAVGIYIAICIAGLIALILLFNSLIKSHDRTLSQQMCSLLTEKISGSLENLAKSVQDVAAVVSEDNTDSYEVIYQKINAPEGSASYVRTGIILLDGTVYATAAEKTDLARQGLITSALESDAMFISKPYRSTRNGQMVFTIFSNIYHENAKIGALYQTYLLDQLMEFTHSDSIDKSAEVWLMEVRTSNIIRCSGSDDSLLGNWSNLMISEKVTSNRKYTEWMQLMRGGAQTASVTYTEDSGTYTQVFEKIGYMDGWSIVARIPNSTFSTTMRTFRGAVILFAVLGITATLVLLITFWRRSEKEKRILENLSVYDSLSQVLNRRAFDYSAAEYLRKPGKVSGALMFLDIDYFKNINDTYGHEAGDNVIITFAAELKKIFGECGLVSRYGGDEFIVLIKNKTESEVNAMIEQFRQNLHSFSITDKDDSVIKLEIQFSAGLVKFSKESSDFKELINRADAALYQVKESGRNNYAWWRDEALRKKGSA